MEDRKVNARLPQLLTVSFYTPPEGLGKGQAGNGPRQGKGQDWQGGTSISRSCHLRKATADCMADDATLLVSLDVLYAPSTSFLPSSLSMLTVGAQSKWFCLTTVCMVNHRNLVQS